MDIAHAIALAGNILDEELSLPTVDYIDPVNKWQQEIKDNNGVYRIPSAEALKAIEWQRKRRGAAPNTLHFERGKHPRPVRESPYDYVFKSDNFDMLKRLLAQLPEDNRSKFVDALLSRIPVARARRPEELRFPCHQHQMSELPLVAEFCVRTGYAGALMSVLGELEKLNLGVLLMMFELEEMIALNFTLFSSEELRQIPAKLHPLLNTCEKIITIGRVKRTRGGMTFLPGVHEIESVAAEIQKSIIGIAEECRKAQHFYLRDQLLQDTPNLEVDADRTTVESFLVKLGFDSKMVGALNAAESDYKTASNTFELKSCLGHLRSFLEFLHRESAESISSIPKDVYKDSWGGATDYLRKKGLITKQHESFVTALYTLMSDDGVHALGTEREYARLLRNMVIEYGLMFLTMLNKKGHPGRSDSARS